jgi:hypothetical protein
LYYAALEKEPAQRNVFLDRACGGDEGLRSEVESLLAQNVSRDGLRDHAAAVNVNVFAPSLAAEIRLTRKSLAMRSLNNPWQNSEGAPFGLRRHEPISVLAAPRR